MRLNRDFQKGLWLGAVLVLLTVLIMGVVDTKATNNINRTTHAFRSIFCSADGLIVYVCEDEAIYRSRDAGENWTVVLKITDETY